MASYRVHWHEQFPDACRAGAAAIGKFDGVHRGHVALVERTRQLARSFGGPTVLVAFDPPPLALLRPDITLELLTTAEDRDELLHAAGADHVLTIHTTRDLLDLTAAAFFEEVIVRRLAARGLAEGPNFCFGRKRDGDIALLGKLCDQAGIRLDVVTPIRDDGAEISSGRVRATLAAGDVRAAARLLGRPYLLRGMVSTGEQLARKLGFPTANLIQIPTVIPADGVYAVRIRGAGSEHAGAANIGPSPTFGQQARKVEVHLLDFHGELVGQSLAVEFIKRLRDVRKFASVEALVAQLRQDVEAARRVLASAQ